MKKIAIILCILVLLVACTPEKAEVSTENNQAETNNEQTKTENSQKQQVPDTQETVEETPKQEESSTFKALLSKNVEYEVTYDMVTSAQADTLTNQITQYFKNGKIRTDTAYLGVTAQSFYIGDKHISCATHAGPWTCSEFELDDTDISTTAFLDFKDNPDKYDAQKLPSKLILDQKTSCYRVPVEEEGINIDYCYSSEGVPLYIHSNEDGQTTTLTALKYSTSVADSVFEFPAEPVKAEPYIYIEE